MLLYFALLALHLTGAAVWVGGHLVLALGVLPAALRARDPGPVTAFEARFERLGLAALALQIATGLVLSLRILPDPAMWFDADQPLARAVLLKLALLIATLALALHARLFVLPGLAPRRLPLLAAHIVGVSVLSLGFLLAGVSFRFGGW